MEIIFSLILTLALILGQLIKLPLGNGGMTILDITVSVFCILGLLKLKIKLKKPPQFLFTAMVFILIATLSLILTPLNLQLSQYLISFSYTIRFSLYILLGWEIFSGAYPSIKRTIPAVLTFSGLSLAILGLLQLCFLPDLRFLTPAGWDPHYFRTASTFLDPNFLGSYFALTLILLISHLRGGNSLTPRVYITFTLIYLALLTTFSRGAYLTFGVGFLTLSFLFKSTRLAIITIVLFLGLLLGFFTYQKTIAEPRGINRTQSAEFRLTTWQQGRTLFESHPILGVGFNAYRYALKEYRLGDDTFLRSHGSSTNDSSLLFVAATTGIVGLVGFLFFLFSLVKSKKPFVIAGLMGLIIQSFFANTLFYPPLLLWVILLASL